MPPATSPATVPAVPGATNSQPGAAQGATPQGTAPGQGAGAAEGTSNAADEAGRGESVGSAGESFAPNMIGDMGSGRTLHSVLQLPSYLGPTQSGSIVFSTVNPTLALTGLPQSPIQFNVQNYTIQATPGSLIAPTTYTSTLSSTATATLAQVQNLALTNSDSAAMMQLANSVSSSLSLSKGSVVSVPNSGASASLTYTDTGTTYGGPYPRPVSPNDGFAVAQPFTYNALVTPPPITINLPSPSSGFLGCQRIADNENVIPTDRVFCDYSFFHDAYLTLVSDVNRFVPGFEKTFLDGRMSLEMRLPIGILEDNNVVADQASYGNTGQVGDLQLILKGILVQRDDWTLSAGLGVSVPTAPDINVGLSDGTPLLKIANQATHLQPFVGVLAKPGNDWFVQAFLELDVAANGNQVSANLTGNGLTYIGDIYDQTLFFADVEVGRWLYRNPAQPSSGIAAVVEAHYTGGLNAPTALQAGNYLIGDNGGAYDVLDLTVGLHAAIGKTTVTLGYVAPIANDRDFEGEVRFFVNRKF